MEYRYDGSRKCSFTNDHGTKYRMLSLKIKLYLCFLVPFLIHGKRWISHSCINTTNFTKPEKQTHLSHDGKRFLNVQLTLRGSGLKENLGDILN